MAKRRDPKLGGKFSKAEVRAELAREQRTAARKRVRDLRAAVADLRKRRKDAIADARARCRAGRLEAQERARALRLRLLDEMRAAVMAERQNARSACDVRLSSARGLRGEIAQARAAYEAERRYQADLRRIESGNRARTSRVTRATTAERRSESDDEVRTNIPADLIPLWNRLRRQFRGSPRRSRTEEFLEYVEAHPEEAIDSIEELSEKHIARMVREQEKAAAEAERAELEARDAERALAERVERLNREIRAAERERKRRGAPMEDAPF